MSIDEAASFLVLPGQQQGRDQDDDWGEDTSEDAVNAQMTALLPSFHKHTYCVEARCTVISLLYFLQSHEM